VLTVGIDLAAQPRDSALCALEWTGSQVVVQDVHPNVSDEQIVNSIRAAHKTGLDVPFGWPTAFVQAVHAWAGGKPWTNGGSNLWMRATDVVVQPIKQPLSVSSDRIARTAARAARVLTQAKAAGIDITRAGDGKVVEVYPAAALKRWDLPCIGYKDKKPECASIKKQIVATLVDKVSLNIRGEQRTLCEESDHALDALVAALIARAHAIGLCDPIPNQQRTTAAIEGWIALPGRDCLRYLRRGTS
jgi:predicted nuclease with RNAse H fold